MGCNIRRALPDRHPADQAPHAQHKGKIEAGVKYAQNNALKDRTFHILDRFLHHAQVIAITGRSYRLKDQPLAGREERQKPAKANEPSTAEPAS